MVFFLFIISLVMEHLWQAAQNRSLLTTLYLLESTITHRQAEAEVTENGKPKPSWTKRLLLDLKLLCSKIRYGN